jgi:hypothetical protein
MFAASPAKGDRSRNAWNTAWPPTNVAATRASWISSGGPPNDRRPFDLLVAHVTVVGILAPVV